MVVRWTARADKRTEEIFRFYEQKSERVARKIVSEIRTSAEQLITFPQMAAVDRFLTERPETFRSLVVVRGLFKIIYFVNEIADEIVIVSVWDCRQNLEYLKNEIRP
jgi:plasmid stabilization system protein ParE